MKKRGLSPVIATVLLISIALILAVIIFLWARSFVSEKVQKFDEPIENACENVKIKVEAIGGDGIYIENIGNVALYGIDVNKKGSGSISGVESFRDSSVTSGQTGNVALPSLITDEEIVVIPVIVGETNTNRKAHVCDGAYGIPTTVI